MPELPEVETVVRSLRAPLTGRTIVGVEVYWPRSIVPSDPPAFSHRLSGQQIKAIERRGKWVMVTLSEDMLLIHLRMTGRLMFTSGTRTVDDRHLRVRLILDNGQALDFVDPRKFGRMILTNRPDEALGNLGPEPLGEDFTAAWLGEMLTHRRGRIKTVLLDQSFLAGLGNIYSDEALWRAGIHPLREARSLAPAEVEQLHQAIRNVLSEAIAGGGTTLADQSYRQPDGRQGDFAAALAVYRRAGRPCPRCGAAIERVRLGQRGACYCPVCQKF
ncbi:MAG: bifunctional DNA-formamidopyrimidine glycosylase/DNA-(apurinic or apyrimidinic site) lyase [Anaerolineae bacterium]|nr:bifunctional DNA-formamidopyrimidine glycosylase/DNA-(apurinic or apyrimidinic site) lyase [Anaerolineae bacterium]